MPEPTTDLLEAKRALSDRFIMHAAPVASGAGLRRSGSRRIRDAVAHARQNVNAVGIGRKMVDEKPTGEPCVRLYVTQKLPRSLLSRGAMLPAQIDGIPTDVIESEPAFLALPARAAACTTKRKLRQRPVQGGISAGHEDVSAGTIAYFFRSTAAGDDPEKLLILSNNHVFADVNQAAIGDSLLQPAPLDGGVAKDAFARLLRFIPIDLGGGGNLVDAAVGVLNPRLKAKLEICSIGKVTGVSTAKEGGKVRKHGRTSGLTFGTIVDTSVDAVVGMDHDDPSVTAVFVNQIRVNLAAPSRAFGLGGDSGSLVVTQAKKPRAVGLYFAGPASGSYGLASPMRAVLTALRIALAT